MGFSLTGILGGSEATKRKDYNTGIETIKYQYLIIDGVTSYRVTSDIDYRDKLMFGDQVTFEVTPNIFNNKMYLKGDLIDS